MGKHAFNQLILVAAGSGKRYGEKKQFIDVANLPIFFHALLRFCPHVYFENIVVVVPVGTAKNYTSKTNALFNVAESFLKKNVLKTNFVVFQAWLLQHRSRIFFISGGAERWQSVQHGLVTLKNKIALKNKPNAVVWIHDAARALLAKKDLSLLIKTAASNVNIKKIGLVPCNRITDTIKSIYKSSRNSNLEIENNLDRNLYVTVTTPQIFPYIEIEKSYLNLFEKKDTKKKVSIKQASLLTDDASVYLQAGYKVIGVPFLFANNKLTFYEEGKSYFKALIKKNLF